MHSERERIRVNFEPLSEHAFTRYFFEVWDRLYEKVGDRSKMPGYLQLLTLLSVHVFNQEKVGVTVYEVHVGGRNDPTNFFEAPVVCGFHTHRP